MGNYVLPDGQQTRATQYTFGEVELRFVDGVSRQGFFLVKVRLHRPFKNFTT